MQSGSFVVIKLALKSKLRKIWNNFTLTFVRLHAVWLVDAMLLSNVCLVFVLVAQRFFFCNPRKLFAEKFHKEYLKDLVFVCFAWGLRCFDEN